MKKKDLYKIIKKELIKTLQEQRGAGGLDPIEKPDPAFDASTGNVAYDNWGIYFCVQSATPSAGGLYPYVGFAEIGGRFCCDGNDNPNGMSNTDVNYPTGATSAYTNAFGFPIGCESNCTQPNPSSDWNTWLSANNISATDIIGATDNGNPGQGPYSTALGAGGVCCPQFGNTLNGTCIGCMDSTDPNYDSGYTIDDPNDCAGQGTLGCMTSGDCNEDPSATISDPSQCVGVPNGSCESCGTDAAGNPAVVTDPLCACADPAATNYNQNNLGCPDANNDPDPNDTSCCTYPQASPCWDIEVRSCNPFDSVGQQQVKVVACKTYNGQQPQAGDDYREFWPYNYPNPYTYNSQYTSYEILTVTPSQLDSNHPSYGDICDGPNQCPGNCSGGPVKAPDVKQPMDGFAGVKGDDLEDFIKQSRRIRESMNDTLFNVSSEKKLKKLIKNIIKKNNEK